MIVIFASAQLFRRMRSSDKKNKLEGSHPSVMRSCSCVKKKKTVSHFPIKVLQFHKNFQTAIENEKFGDRKQGIFQIFLGFSILNKRRNQMKKRKKMKKWNKSQNKQGERNQ